MSSVNSAEDAVSSTPERHRRLRGAAVGLSGIVAILLGVLFLVVRGVETDTADGVTDSTYGAYLFLAITDAVCAGAYAVLDRRAVWLAGLPCRAS